jgi:hypothetical protein
MRQVSGPRTLLASAEMRSTKLARSLAARAAGLADGNTQGSATKRAPRRTVGVGAAHDEAADARALRTRHAATAYRYTGRPTRLQTKATGTAGAIGGLVATERGADARHRARNAPRPDRSYPDTDAARLRGGVTDLIGANEKPGRRGRQIGRRVRVRSIRSGIGGASGARAPRGRTAATAASSGASARHASAGARAPRAQAPHSRSAVACPPAGEAPLTTAKNFQIGPTTTGDHQRQEQGKWSLVFQDVIGKIVPASRSSVSVHDRSKRRPGIRSPACYTRLASVRSGLALY